MPEPGSQESGEVCAQCGSPKFACMCPKASTEAQTEPQVEARFDDERKQAALDALSSEEAWDAFSRTATKQQALDALGFHMLYTGENSSIPPQDQRETPFTKAVKEKIVIDQRRVQDLYNSLDKGLVRKD